MDKASINKIFLERFFFIFDVFFTFVVHYARGKGNIISLSNSGYIPERSYLLVDMFHIFCIPKRVGVAARVLGVNVTSQGKIL